MSVTADLFLQVQQRANYACEYCGISETDAGGQLTIDHFQPRSKGGDDSLENLVYACTRCNLYKQDYWPQTADAPRLWNPRQEPATTHFLELDDGRLGPLTPTGTFSLQRLRLNREPLVAYRYRKRQHAEAVRLLSQYNTLLHLLNEMNVQLATLLEQQQALLREQQRLLALLLENES